MKVSSRAVPQTLLNFYHLQSRNVPYLVDPGLCFYIYFKLNNILKYDRDKLETRYSENLAQCLLKSFRGM